MTLYWRDGHAIEGQQRVEKQNILFLLWKISMDMANMGDPGDFTPNSGIFGGGSLS